MDIANTDRWRSSRARESAGKKQCTSTGTTRKGLLQPGYKANSSQFDMEARRLTCCMDAENSRLEAR